MKANEKKQLINYLRDNKNALAKYYNEPEQKIEELIDLLENELIDKGVRVSYITECIADKNGGRVGTQYICRFDSLKDAMEAPLPEGYVFAIIHAEEGKYYYDKINGGWTSLQLNK